MEPIICVKCHKPYIPKVRKLKICSSCRGLAQAGAKNHAYSGGRITKFGYKQIKVNGKYIFEHRHVMEQFLGRKMQVREKIHHKDGNKLNNLLENLELCDSQAEHLKKHATWRNDTHKQCSKCGETFPRENFAPRNTPNTDTHQSWCRRCSRIAVQDWQRRQREKI